jgi:hypothetical protein
VPQVVVPVDTMAAGDNADNLPPHVPEWPRPAGCRRAPTCGSSHPPSWRAHAPPRSSALTAIASRCARQMTYWRSGG